MSLDNKLYEENKQLKAENQQLKSLLNIVGNTFYTIEKNEHYGEDYISIGPMMMPNKNKDKKYFIQEHTVKNILLEIYSCSITSTWTLSKYKNNTYDNRKQAKQALKKLEE